MCTGTSPRAPGIHFASRRLQRSDEVVRRKDDELLDHKDQLSRLRGDFDELRGQYAALTQQGHGGSMRELSVRKCSCCVLTFVTAVYHVVGRDVIRQRAGGCRARLWQQQAGAATSIIQLRHVASTAGGG